MRWMNHELDDEPSPEPYDECPDGWDYSVLQAVLLAQRAKIPTLLEADLEVIRDWLFPAEDTRQVTRSQRPGKPNKNMDFRPKVFVQPDKPLNPSPGDVWINTGDEDI